MSILVVNQSVIDTFASLFSFLLLMDRKVTGLSHDSAYDQFMCRIVLLIKPLWCMLITSTYGILITTLSRYIAVIYPIQYKIVRIFTNVRFVCNFCRAMLRRSWYCHGKSSGRLSVCNAEVSWSHRLEHFKNKTRSAGKSPT